jgi:hypothetical protein
VGVIDLPTLTPTDETFAQADNGALLQYKVE